MLLDSSPINQLTRRFLEGSEESAEGGGDDAAASVVAAEPSPQADGRAEALERELRETRERYEQESRARAYLEGALQSRAAEAAAPPRMQRPEPPRPEDYLEDPAKITQYAQEVAAYERASVRDEVLGTLAPHIQNHNSMMAQVARDRVGEKIRGHGYDDFEQMWPKVEAAVTRNGQDTSMLGNTDVLFQTYLYLRDKEGKSLIPEKSASGGKSFRGVRASSFTPSPGSPVGVPREVRDNLEFIRDRFKLGAEWKPKQADLERLVALHQEGR